MLIKGQRVILRAIEVHDSRLLQDMVNSEFLEQYENGFNFPLSSTAQSIWMDEHLCERNCSRLIIELDGDPVGYMSITDVDWKNRSCHTGIKLFNESNTHKGIGTDALMAVMRFCFEQMNMHRLESCLLEYNDRSKGLFVDKCGWSIEGIKRSAVFKNGAFHDLLMIAILKDDYDKTVENTNYWTK